MTVEIRYLNVDAWTVNNLYAHKLITTPEVATSNHSSGLSGTLQTGYWAIDVAVRHADDSETPLGSKVAQVSKSTVGIGYIFATWECPQTALEDDDAIVVRVYGKIGAGAWTLLGLVFITEQLGAQSLDAATWTVYYTIRIVFYPPATYQYLYYHDVYLSEDEECEIDNFTWTPTAAVGVACKRLLVGVGL